METTFVADYDNACPYCNGIMDYVDDNCNEKQCVDCGKKFKVFTVEV